MAFLDTPYRKFSAYSDREWLTRAIEKTWIRQKTKTSMAKT